MVKKIFCIFLLITAYIHSNDYIITIPKTGTNLLLKLCFLIDQANGIDVRVKNYQDKERKNPPDWLHIWKVPIEGDTETLGPTEEKIQYILDINSKIIISVRDPRGFAAALAEGHGKKTEGVISRLGQMIDYPGAFIASYIGNDYYLKFKTMTALYDEYLSWKEYPFVYATSFELLVGPKGGGNREAQVQEIQNIADHLEKQVSYKSACDIADQLFGGTNTFKRGQISGWQDDFSKKQHRRFLSKERNLITRLGYPIHGDCSIKEK